MNNPLDTATRQIEEELKKIGGEVEKTQEELRKKQEELRKNNDEVRRLEAKIAELNSHRQQAHQKFEAMQNNLKHTLEVEGRKAEEEKRKQIHH